MQEIDKLEEDLIQLQIQWNQHWKQELPLTFPLIGQEEETDEVQLFKFKEEVNFVIGVIETAFDEGMAHSWETVIQIGVRTLIKMFQGRFVSFGPYVIVEPMASPCKMRILQSYSCQNEEVLRQAVTWMHYLLALVYEILWLYVNAMKIDRVHQSDNERITMWEKIEVVQALFSEASVLLASEQNLPCENRC